MAHYVVFASIGQLRLERVLHWAYLYTPMRYAYLLDDLADELLALHLKDRRCQ